MLADDALLVPDDAVLHLLHLPRLRRTSRLLAQGLQLLFRAFDAFLELGDVVPCKPVAPVEHVAHPDQEISLFLQVFEHAFVPGFGFVLEEGLRCGKVFGGCVDAFIQERDLIRVDGVSVHAVLCEARQGEAEAEGICCEAFVALGEPFKERAELDIDLGGALDARADGVKGFAQRCGQAVFEVSWETSAGEFFGHGNGGLFAPDGEFLILVD